MRIAITASVLVAAGAALIAPTVANASAVGQPTSACVTRAQYDQVVVGQTVDQVVAELHTAGDPNGGVTTHHGGQEYAPNFPSCAGPASGVLQFGVDFAADAGQPLRVTAKTGYLV